jgi:opacity protein-like surface antigen
MRSVKSVLAAGAATLISSMAFAADMPIAQPPMYAPPPVDFGGWYLRGDIGFSNQKIRHLDFYSQATTLTLDQQTGFDTAGIFGLGVGYQFNNWFRADVIGQYRGRSNFKGTDVFTFPAGNGVIGNGIDNYSASKSEWLVLANGYVDLGTWWCVTPFVGAGIGAARVTISNFTDNGLTNQSGFPPVAGTYPSSAYAAEGSKWNFAWALHAGLAYRVSPNLTVELAYSYMNLGSGITGNVAAYDSPTLGNKFTFKDITSNDVKLGVRWNLDSPPAYMPPPPLVTKG